MDRFIEIKAQLRELSWRNALYLEEHVIDEAADILFRREDLVMIMAAFPPFSQAWNLCSEKIVNLEAKLIALEPGLML